MGIVLYNTEKRRKEPLEPRVPGRVGIYVCGVTVYDHCHIGHARVMVVFDVIVRHLRASGLEVKYVRNFTDIDDKIIRRANEQGIGWKALTEEYIDAFHEEMDALGVARADVEPKATDHLDEMTDLIEKLEAKGLAYPSGGDVLYSVDRFEGYGRLSGKNLDDLQAGSRVEVDREKKNPLDFVLWKGAKPDEPKWPSPWGEGRPGWHIECSAMSCKYLGESFDIHGGGLDLIFPHHENEIAQTEGATGHHWVRHWMHNGFVNVVSETGEAEKMSKSLGNFMTIKDLRNNFSGETLRLFILNSHYRSPLDFSQTLLKAAQSGLNRLYTALQGAKEVLGSLPEAQPDLQQSDRGGPFEGEVKRFWKAMDDDFNTPQALAVLFEVVKRLNRLMADGQGSEHQEELRVGVGVLRGLGMTLGLAGQEPEAHFTGGSDPDGGEGSDDASEGDGGLSNSDVDALVEARSAARKARNWAEGDRIRDQLKELGITVLDGKDGSSWRRS
ncbi:MAG: cysteine--tRNA ligase [Magnetococcales bacterium]|nr:cysteine--tRNA ligase [Magnetococcales bacterium]